MKVAVVILNWNGKAFLERFLPSVIAHNGANAAIFVADNASTDDSVEFVRTNFPQVNLILNRSNGGYAKGYNDALRGLEAEYYVLLNSDVEVSPGWLDAPIKMMDEDRAIAACQPKILMFDDRSYFEYAGAAGGFIDKMCFPFCRGRILHELEKDTGQYDSPREIFWASGACLFVRSKSFHETGGFDEDFFAHMEEIDLCWRMKNRGHKVMFCPGSTIFHVGGGTLNKTSSRKTFLNFRNNLILIVKNHPRKWLFWKMWFRMNLDGVAAIMFLLRGQFSHFWAVLRAHFSFYMNLRTSLRKRRFLTKRIHTYTTTGVYLHAIVFDFYLRGKRKFSEIDFPERFKAGSR